MFERTSDRGERGGREKRMGTIICRVLCVALCFCSAAHAGLILHLGFEGDAENFGSLGASHDGTTFGDASYSNDAIRGAYSVDMGANGYVKVPSFTLGDAATVATWVNADFNRDVENLARDGMNTVFSTRLSTSSPSGALFYVNRWNTQDRAVLLETGIDSGYTGMGTAAGSVENNTWQHLAVTFNRTTDVVEFYVDGTKLPSSDSFYETFPDNREMFIGAPGTLEWWHFGGKIDDFRVYDSVLTQSEISDLVGTSPVPEPGSMILLAGGLVGVYGFLAKRRIVRDVVRRESKVLVSGTDVSVSR